MKIKPSKYHFDMMSGNVFHRKALTLLSARVFKDTPYHKFRISLCQKWISGSSTICASSVLVDTNNTPSGFRKNGISWLPLEHTIYVGQTKQALKKRHGDTMFTV